MLSGDENRDEHPTLKEIRCLEIVPFDRFYPRVLAP